MVEIVEIIKSVASRAGRRSAAVTFRLAQIGPSGKNSGQDGRVGSRPQKNFFPLAQPSAFLSFLLQAA